MAEQAIHDLVVAQFGANASAYVTSPTHSDSESLSQLVLLVAPAPHHRALDVATGAGHTALAFAPHVAEIVAYDLTPAMLAEAERAATERGLKNFRIQQGLAESMPFAAEEFDLVTVRTAPHHFADLDAFVSETYRVLKPGGKFLLVDTTVPDDEQVAVEINQIEKLRDPSHGRNLSSSEWKVLVEKHDFMVTSFHTGWHANGKKMEVHQWMDRIRTPAENRSEILGAFLDPTPELVEALDIERKGEEIWFSLPELTLLAVKPA